MHPILFLDIDGVLTVTFEGGRPFTPASVRALNRILAETGARVVVSSSWRLNRGHPPTLCTVEELQRTLGGRGLPAGCVLDRTPFLTTTRPTTDGELGRSRILVAAPRRDEIRAWLDAHPEFTSWAVLDDCWDAGPANLIHCESRVGLTEELADEVIAKLRAVR